MQRKNEYGFDQERLKLFISLSPEEKLNHLESMNELIEKITPKRSKKIWAELKKKGW